MNDKIVNAMEFYYLTTTLKEKIRQGWLYWNVSADRLESIAEHIFGCCMLAISIHSEFDYDIDIKKVIMMLALHETEEIKIPDITPFDKVTAKEKLDMGNIAVNEVCNNLAKKDVYISLLLNLMRGKQMKRNLHIFVIN